MCPLLQESGLPSPCVVNQVDLALSLILVPFLIWRLVSLGPTARQGPGAANPRCREASLYLAAIGSVLPLFRDSWWGLGDALAQILVVFPLQRNQRLLYLSVPEVQLWWAQRALVEVSRSFSEPGYINFAVMASVIATLALESLSNPGNATKYEDATIWGRINQSFVQDMIDRSMTKILDPEDFAGVPNELRSDLAHDEFRAALDRQNPQAKYRVFWAMMATYKWNYVFLIAVEVLDSLVNYTRPLLLAQFLNSLVGLRDRSVPWALSLYLGIALASVDIVSSCLSGVYSVTSSMIFCKSRSALQESMYRKSLVLDPGSRDNYDSSRIMNLMNVDASMVQIAFLQLPTLVSAPLGLALCTVQLYMFMGRTMLAAVPVFLAYAPFTSWCTKRLVKRFPEAMAAKDSRAKSTMSIIRNIKSLKLYAWEEPYEDQVLTDRNQELAVQRKFLWYNTAMSTVTSQLDNIVAAAVFVAFLFFTRKPLSPQIVFPALSMLSLVSDPLFAFPRVITSIGRANTAQLRMNDFLRQPEEDLQNYERNSTGAGVDVTDATIQWSKSGAVAIEKLTMSVKPGDLCCVLGKVGAGKSALVRALCGQMFVDTGKVAIHGRIAYCAQEPWLQFKSLRDNILFGLDYDEEFYKQVVSACDLDSDLALFDEGDQTQIGEKGIRLSGGQKARVALARAVYSRADVVILDDVLSAVDEHVSRKLVDGLLAPQGLLAGRAVILATNSGKVLKYASHVVCLSDRKAQYVGPLVGQVAVDSLPLPEGHATLPEPGFDRQKEVKASGNVNLVAPRPKPEIYSMTKVGRDEMFPDVPVFGVFKRYMAATGKWTAVFALSMIFFSTIIRNLVTVWLTIWSDKYLVGVKASQLYVAVYLGLSVVAALTMFLADFVFQGPLVLTASRKVHEGMLRNVSRAPMTFFERTPLGSVMNRFTGDVNMLDNQLPGMMQGFIRSSFSVIASLSVAVVGAPFILIVLAPLMISYNSYRVQYVPCSRQLQKLNSAARGPILSHIEESFKGAGTLAAFGARDPFTHGYEQRSDAWMRTNFLRSSLRRWLNYRIKLLTSILVLSSTLSLVALVGKAGVAVGVAGVVLHSVQLAGQRLSWIISTWTDLEVSVVAVERIFEYTDMPTEAPAYVPEREPPANWPSKGHIQFDSYSTRFRPDLPLVLKDISLDIKPGEKVGVVGRTGAGKSTLTLALFRLVEASGGHIDIDTLNAGKLGLFDLRSRLSIIPQDAQIFKGTLRSNLDPLGTADDARLWQVLELCHLKSHFSGQDGLDTPLAEGGDNISRGQAQLICLGRALLRPGTILVLDEATASVDTHTDSLVQETIRAEFNDRTIVTIAHRLNTVMDSDRILVLSGGEVVEFDTPANLLAAKGAFYGLVQSHKGELLE